MLKAILVLLTLMTVGPLSAFDKNVDVIAVEYPPFTGRSEPEGGLAFQLLNDLTVDEQINWKPFFLPPKRAYNKIESGDWCASFYPVFSKTYFKQYELGKGLVKIGLVRLSKPTPFMWSSIDDLQVKSVALLSTESRSEFAMQFENSGVKVVNIETIQAAIKMVLLKRVDIAMVDNISYSNLESKYKKQLQFSENALYETKISIFINDKCDISFLNLKEFKPKK